MAKFRPKIKGQSKGKRWPKGQSSNSNPETRKYRDQAKFGFFQVNSGSKSNLTSDALLQHDKIQQFSKSDDRNDLMQTEDDVVSGSAISASTFGGSAKTFASEWSDCTNMSFNRFMNSYTPNSALHKEMLAILAAITQVIKEKNGTENSSEYYCCLLTTLEEVYNAEMKNEEQITAVLSLLNMSVRATEPDVLRLTFTDTATKMLHILREYVNSDNNTIIKSALMVLGILLRKQELAIWSHDISSQILSALLNPFSIHQKPKWRKAAQEAIVLIIESAYFEGATTNIAADKVAAFCEETLDGCMGSGSSVLVSSVQAGQTTILHTLGLMKRTITKFSKSHLKKCCEIILRLINLNYPIVTSCGLQVLHSLFSSQKAVVPSKLNAQLISALYDYQPASSDVQPSLAWLLVMQQAHVHLADVDVGTASTVMPRIFSTITQLWLSERPEVTTAATHALEVLLRDGITAISSDKKLVEQYSAKLLKCFQAVESGLGYQYHNVWHQVLYLCGVMFEVAGQNCSELLLNCLKTLAELRDSYKFSFNNELEHAVGAAIRSMGPETVLGVISLKKENGDLNLDRSWMLPVLKENIKGSTIDYFVKGILPLALYCQRRSKQLAEANDGIGAHSSELLYIQLWNLLPCFCNQPTDIKDNFKSIAKVLGTAISDRKELRLAVMASIRKLISSAKEQQNDDDIKELARFDKNYLPILFNVYTTKPIGSDEEGQRLAALDTIKVYLTIARPELTEELLKNAIKRLNSSSEDPEDSFIKESILDLIRALVPYQKVDNIKLLYEQCVKSLPEIKNSKEQKKAYRLLEEICGSQSENCKQFIKNNRKEVQVLLKKSLNMAAVSSKGARLRCLNYLIKAQPQLDHESKLIRSVIPEAILSCKDINERTRTVAYDILNTIGETLLSHDQMEQFITMVSAGLAGNVQLISCTILGLASILHNFSGSLGLNNINLLFDNVMVLLKSSTREIVSSCLSFVKVFCKTMPAPMVGASLPTIIKTMADMTDDCKRHFRMKTREILDRLVRKYGFDAISPHVPSTDTILYKRIRNLKKLNARKQKQKELKKGQENEDESEEEEFLIKAKKQKSIDEILADSDESDDDDKMEVNDMKHKKQMNTWIEEGGDNIVDLADPSAISKITSTKPGLSNLGTQQQEKKKEKDRGFKTASDGRLIIEDLSSDSDNDKKNLSDSDSDDDDEGSVAETLVLGNRKRKRAATSSVKSGVSSSSQIPYKYKPGGVGIHRPTNNAVGVGSEYKAKKAKGDVKKKGKLDPYAYVPLKRTAINKRKKAKAAGQYKNLIKAAKSGALKGAKMKSKK